MQCWKFSVVMCYRIKPTTLYRVHKLYSAKISRRYSILSSFLSIEKANIFIRWRAGTKGNSDKIRDNFKLLCCSSPVYLEANYLLLVVKFTPLSHKQLD